MSVITNVILAHSICEDSEEMPGGEDHFFVMDAINEWLKRENGGCFNEVGQFAGGGKGFSIPLYAYCGNYLNYTALLEVIRAQKWECPDEVRVWIEDEFRDRGIEEFRIERSAVDDL